MKDANLRAVYLILSQLKKEAKCFAQITRSGPSSHALSDPSRRLQKAMNKLVRAERIQLLASLLAKLRTEIPSKDLKRIVATLHRLHRQSPPDKSELAPRKTLRTLIQALKKDKTSRLEYLHQREEHGSLCLLLSGK